MSFKPSRRQVLAQRPFNHSYSGIHEPQQLPFESTGRTHQITALITLASRTTAIARAETLLVAQGTFSADQLQSLQSAAVGQNPENFRERSGFWLTARCSDSYEHTRHLPIGRYWTLSLRPGVKLKTLIDQPLRR